MRWLMVLLLVIPAASGQLGYTLDIDAHEFTSFVPINTNATLSIAWTVACEPFADGVAVSADSGFISWKIEAATGIAWSGTQATLVALPPCMTGTASGTHEAQVIPQINVPAFEPQRINVTGTLTWGIATQTFEAEARDQTKLTAGYWPRLEAKLVTTLKQGEPGSTTTFDVAITNFGNGDTVVLTQSDDPNLEVAAVWPEPGQDPIAPGESRMMVIHYHHPEKGGWNNDEAGLPLTLIPAYAYDTNHTGEPISLNMLARTRGVPAPTPLLALGILALALRRR